MVVVVIDNEYKRKIMSIERDIALHTVLLEVSESILRTIHKN